MLSLMKTTTLVPINDRRRHSDFVCKNCGVPVGFWEGKKASYWKHQTGGNSTLKACKDPIPVALTGYQEAAEISPTVAARLNKRHAKFRRLD